MGPYSNDPGAGGPPQSSTPSGAPMWSGAGQQSAPAWSSPYSSGVPAAPVMNAMPPAAMSTQERDPKWPALRLIASILKIVAWIEGGLGVISALVTGGTVGRFAGAGAFLIVLFLLVFVAVGFLVTYATSEIIMLFISIEKNTRQR